MTGFAPDVFRHAFTSVSRMNRGQWLDEHWAVGMSLGCWCDEILEQLCSILSLQVKCRIVRFYALGFRYFFGEYFTTSYTNHKQNIRKFCNAIFKKTRKNVCFLDKILLPLQNCFIFGILKDFCSAVQYSVQNFSIAIGHRTKWWYSALFFKNWHF